MMPMMACGINGSPPSASSCVLLRDQRSRSRRPLSIVAATSRVNGSLPLGAGRSSGRRPVGLRRRTPLLLAMLRPLCLTCWLALLPSLSAPSNPSAADAGRALDASHPIPAAAACSPSAPTGAPARRCCKHRELVTLAPNRRHDRDRSRPAVGSMTRSSRSEPLICCDGGGAPSGVPSVAQAALTPALRV